MKNMRAHLYAVGASLVLTLGVVLAQDLAPAVAQMPDPAPEAPAVAPAAAVPAEPVKRAPTPTPSLRTLPLSARRPVVTAPANARPAPAPANARPSTTSANARLGATPANAQSGTTPADTPTVIEPPPVSASGMDGDASAGTKTKMRVPPVKFKATPAEIVLQLYSAQSGKTLLVTDPEVLKTPITTINPDGQTSGTENEQYKNYKGEARHDLSEEEFLEVVEALLNIHGIVLEPFGEKFIRVLKRDKVRTEGIPTIMDMPDVNHPEKGRVISQMIQLKVLKASEVQTVLEGFKSKFGLLQVFSGRSNSILVTDAQENVNRMLEIVRFMDQSVPIQDIVKCRTIQFAKAKDIEAHIKALVELSQKQQQEAKEEIKANAAGSPGMKRETTTPTPRPTLLPGLRGSTTAQQAAAVKPNETLEALMSDASRGMIRGTVSTLSDERTNQIIIITTKENMDFFDQIIDILDVKVAPEKEPVVHRLLFADAADVADMLNSLLTGSASSKKDDKSAAAKGAAATPGAHDQPTKSTSLAEAAAARTASRAEAVVGEVGKSILGQISKDDITILADKRTNALVMYGSIGVLAEIKKVIELMDIQLSQVMIETVVLQVQLKNGIQTGIDWVKRVSDRGGTRYTVGGGGGNNSAIDLFGAATNLASGTITKGANVLSSTSGIKYLTTVSGLDLDAIISASASDSGVKVLSSPVLLTVDNKKATIEATSMRYLYKGVRSSYTGSSNYAEVPDFEQRDIGLTVDVTPRINPNGVVVLTIKETYETIGADQTVGTAKYPTVNTRKMEADVSIQDRQTVILGGLVDSEVKNEEGGIPLLKDIPYIGKYLFGYTSASEDRTELLVLLTPYVFVGDSDDIYQDTKRRKESLHMEGVFTQGWSESKVADPESAKDKLEREQRRWKRLDEDKKLQQLLEKATKTREEKTRREEEKERAKALLHTPFEVKINAAPSDKSTDVKGAAEAGGAKGPPERLLASEAAAETPAQPVTAEPQKP